MATNLQKMPSSGMKKLDILVYHIIFINRNITKTDNFEKYLLIKKIFVPLYVFYVLY
jgi:hypothetical protein